MKVRLTIGKGHLTNKTYHHHHELTLSSSLSSVSFVTSPADGNWQKHTSNIDEKRKLIKGKGTQVKKNQLPTTVNCWNKLKKLRKSKYTHQRLITRDDEKRQWRCKKTKQIQLIDWTRVQKHCFFFLTFW